MDELLRETRELMEPEWDEHREEHVFAQILERIGLNASPMGRDRTGTFPCLPAASGVSAPSEIGRDSLGRFASTNRAQVWMVSSAVVVAALASVVVWFSQPASMIKSQHTVTTQSSRVPLAPGVSEIMFSTGTRAQLAPGAQVETLEKSGQHIELRQTAGKVSYEIDPERDFHFKVHAREVLIEVVGTVFEVDVERSAVEVHVSRGVVTVTEGERRVDLKAGDDLRINTAVPLEVPKEAKPVAPAPAEVVTWLMKQADQARREKNWEAAARHLQKVVRSYSADGRSINALFTLGRVERARGLYKESAAAFRTVQENAQGSAMMEDALAEEAISLAQGGNIEAARGRAAVYKARFPTGPHQGRLSKLLK